MMVIFRTDDNVGISSQCLQPVFTIESYLRFRGKMLAGSQSNRLYLTSFFGKITINPK